MDPALLEQCSLTKQSKKGLWYAPKTVFWQSSSIFWIEAQQSNPIAGLRVKKALAMDATHVLTSLQSAKHLVTTGGGWNGIGWKPAGSGGRAFPVAGNGQHGLEG